MLSIAMCAFQLAYINIAANQISCAKDGLICVYWCRPNWINNATNKF